uniref:Uncharacterized protein n=1 Tax=Ovis aries TaxID=9940 RepID=A0AC11EGP4_SHEEP
KAGWGSGCIVLWSGLWTLATGVAWAGSRFPLASGNREGASQVVGFITCTTQLHILPPSLSCLGWKRCLGATCPLLHPWAQYLQRGLGSVASHRWWEKQQGSFRDREDPSSLSSSGNTPGPEPHLKDGLLAGTTSVRPEPGLGAATVTGVPNTPLSTPCWTRSTPVWTTWRRRMTTSMPASRNCLNPTGRRALSSSSSLGRPPAMPAPRLWEPPARPQPCLAGSGSGLNTHHLA